MLLVHVWPWWFYGCVVSFNTTIVAAAGAGAAAAAVAVAAAANAEQASSIRRTSIALSLTQ